MILSVKDCSPFDPKPSAIEAEWLGRLAAAVQRGDLVIRLEEGKEDEPVVWCERDGSWWAGRYVGSLTFEGSRLDIRPRFGEETIRLWFAAAFNLALADTLGELIADDWFVPWLLASVWSRAFVIAARHGLPALRTDIRESGLSIRGRLDVPGTVRMRCTGTPGAASLRREKSLNNPISAAVVAAYTELSQWLRFRRQTDWLPERLKDTLPQLVAAVGSRPTIPTLEELDRVKLTPITAGFRPLAKLSVRIAGRHGLAGNASDQNSCKGILLDVAELWELYVLAVLRRAWPEYSIAHGTREESTCALLKNCQGNLLGFLKPDAVIERNKRTVAVVDAKYKQLWPSKWNVPPQREDMYQLAAYLNRYGDSSSAVQGMLAYPLDPTQPLTTPTEAGNPWNLDPRKAVWFLALPHDVDEAARKVRENVPLDVAKSLNVA